MKLIPMHHLPRIFDLRRNSKKMDQTSSPKHKLVRRNAAKNFQYTPSGSTSPSSSHRTRSLELPLSVDRTSIRLDGSHGEVDSIFQSLGLTGPEDFEIPPNEWAAMKRRSSADITQLTKNDYFGVGGNVESEKVPKEEVKKSTRTSPGRFGNDVQVTDTIKVNPSKNEAKICRTVDLFVQDSIARPAVKDSGIKGDRPPLLTPPPAMSIPAIDDGCSTWELFERLAYNDERTSRSPYDDVSHMSDDEDRDGACKNEDNGVRIGETIVRSGSCSFTTNDDDSSSTTTEPVSIISPNGVSRMVITHWEKGSELGRGSFGTVYEGISGEGFFFAVKEVSLLEQGSQGRQSIYQLEQEIDLLSQFEHENIVRYLGTDKVDSKLYIFLELVTQGSLAKLYHKYHLRDSHVSAYTKQILLGLKYLHDRQVVHRDIKCANILVASNGTVKLADFGLAKATRLNDLKSCKGTVFWMAPEVVNHRSKGYGLAADIWSLGCTVLEMLTGHLPYHPLEFTHALFKIAKGEPPSIPENLSTDARDFIQQCLRVNPNDRPTAAELLEHQFVRRPVSAPLGSESPMLPGR